MIPYLQPTGIDRVLPSYCHPLLQTTISHHIQSELWGIPDPKISLSIPYTFHSFFDIRYRRDGKLHTYIVHLEYRTWQNQILSQMIQTSHSDKWNILFLHPRPV